MLELVDADLEPGDLAFLRAGGGVARTPEQYASISTCWDITPIGEPPHATMLRSWRGNRVFIVECTGTPALARRRESHLDVYRGWAQLSFPVAGAVGIESGSRSVRISTGEMGVISFGQEFTLEVERDTVAILLYIPVKLLDARGLDVGPLSGTKSSEGPLLPALTTLLTQLLARRSEAHSWGVETALLELVFNILYECGARGEPDDRLRERVRALIHKRFTDPGLIPDSIAKDLGVSRRRLYTLMEGEENSIATMIRTTRLAHAQYLLRTRPEISLSYISTLCGFRGADQFARAFKTAMGVSPSVFRCALAQQVEADM